MAPLQSTTTEKTATNGRTLGALRRVEVRWPLIISRWNDALGLATFNNGSHTRAALIVDVRMNGAGVASLVAHLETPDGRRRVDAGPSVGHQTHANGRWTHIDVRDESGLLLALSVARDEQPGYVRSDLLARCGIGGAVCEPPIVEPVFAEDEQGD